MNLVKALASLEGIGTFACHAWREKIIRRHVELAPLICRHYKAIAKRQSYVEANQWLLGLEKQLKLGHTGLYLNSSEEQLRDYATAKAHNIHLEIYELVQNVGREIAIRVLRERIALTGLELPLDDEYTKDQAVPALARVVDPRWWLKIFAPFNGADWSNFSASMAASAFTAICM